MCIVDVGINMKLFVLCFTSRIILCGMKSADVYSLKIRKSETQKIKYISYHSLFKTKVRNKNNQINEANIFFLYKRKSISLLA